MRTITEGQAVELLQVHFGLSAPVAFEDVKKRYRKESKRLHPDSDSPDSSEDAFKVLSGAFDGLKQLYQFGSGLFDAEPVSDDAVEDESQPPKMPRETVDGTPLSELGLGLGPTTNGKECMECDGRGYKVVHERGCNGTGRGSNDKVARIYILKCYSCKGSGEIEVLNPVLPKGRLVFNGRLVEQDPLIVTPPITKAASPGKDRLFGEEDPSRMSDLLRELKLKGIGGKR